MNYKKSLISVAVLLSVSAGATINAAGLYNTDCATFYNNNGDSKEKEALQLYNNGIYHMALAQFENIRDNGSTSMTANQIEGYIVLCKIHTQAAGIEETIAKYAKEHPVSSMLDKIYLHYAISLFDNSNYAKSLTYLNKVNNISKDETPDYRFRHAYCLMRVGEQRQSASEFKALIESLNGTVKSRKYLTASQYYLGYILYSKQNFKCCVSSKFSNVAF